MTGQTINFKTLADDFQNLALHHKQLNSFGLGDVSQLSYWTQLRDKEENTEYQAPYYPLLYVVPSKITNELHYKTWEFNTVVGDIVERNLANQVDTVSDTLQILQDVISQFRLSVTENLGNYNEKYYLDEAVVCTPFLEKHDDLLNGWNGLLKIKTMTYLDRCSAAFNTFTGTPIQHLEGINFKTFHDDFRMLADHHKQLNSFGFGSVEDFTYWTESRDKEDNPNFQAPIYPLLYVVPGEVKQNFGYMNYGFTIIVSDIIERDLKNQTDVLSDTNQILDDIISQFRLSVTDSLGNFNNEYYLDESIECIPFLEKYDDLLGGWTAELNIEVKIPLNRCDAAFDTFIVSPTPTPAITNTPTPSVTSTPQVTQTPTITTTPTITATPTNTGTPAVTNTPTNTNTPSTTSTQTPTNTPSVTATSTPTNTPSVTATNTQTPTATATPGNTPTRTPDVTPTNTPTTTQTGTPSVTSSPTTTPTNTPTITQTGTPNVTSSPTTTPSNTPTQTQTGTPAITSTPTNTPSVTQTGTPSVTKTPTNTPSVTQTGTPAITSSPTTTPTNTPTITQTGTPNITPTNTPSQTQSGTPSVTQTPTLTPTITNTPSNTPTLTQTPTGTITYQYGWTLVTTPYNPPSSGNTIFLSSTGGTGTTNPNTFNLYGVYWSVIDRTGTDTTAYFSGITGSSFQVSFYQNGQTAIYSGNSGAIVYSKPGALTANFNYDATARPNQLTLVQSASTNFNTSLPVYIKWETVILPTPTPTITQTNTPSVTPTNTLTPTNTITPTNTQTPSVTPSITPTLTQTPTASSTKTYQFTGTTFDSSGATAACSSIYVTDNVWGYNSTYGLNATLWSNSGATAPLPFGYYAYQGTVLQVAGGGIVIGSSTCPTPTPTVTATNTPTVTPTLTQTPTPTRVPIDTDAALYLSAVTFNGGTLNSTLSAATYTLFSSLKSAGIYTKLYAMYPILGGVANSHMLNALNPINTNAAYRIAFSGTVSHSASGMTGNGTTGWGNTNFKGTNYVNNMSMGVYINATGSTQTSGSGGVQMGCDSTNGANTYLQINANSNLLRGAIYNRSTDNPNTQLTGRTGFYAMSKTGTTTNIYCQNGNFTTTGTTNPDFNAAVNLALMAYNQGIEYGGGVNSYCNDRLAFAYMSSGLTITELTSLKNIVQTFQTSCGRNV